MIVPIGSYHYLKASRKAAESQASGSERHTTLRHRNTLEQIPAERMATRIAAESRKWRDNVESSSGTIEIRSIRRNDLILEFESGQDLKLSSETVRSDVLKPEVRMKILKVDTSCFVDTGRDLVIVRWSNECVRIPIY